MPGLTIVGGAGYIGRRLCAALARRQLRFRVIDPCILGDDATPHLERADVRDVPTSEFEEDVVVWLPAIHKMPAFEPPSGPGPQRRPINRWEEISYELSVRQPSRIAVEAEKLIYLSSMQVVHGEPSMYAQHKREGEAEVASMAKRFTILRPGTVYGGLADPGPRRVQTVPNRYLVTGELPDENWSAFICPIEAVVGAVCTAITDRATDGECTNLTTSPEPLVAADLAKAVEGHWSTVPPNIDPSARHPLEAYAEYYEI